MRYRDTIEILALRGSQSTKWKILRGCAKLAVRCRLIKSMLAHRLAHGAGLTALHYAARRGDVEIVTLLLEAGADPYIENDLGMNAFVRYLRKVRAVPENQTRLNEQ